jgi:hypothetical protein
VFKPDADRPPTSCHQVAQKNAQYNTNQRMSRASHEQEVQNKRIHPYHDSKATPKARQGIPNRDEQ